MHVSIICHILFFTCDCLLKFTRSYWILFSMVQCQSRKENKILRFAELLSWQVNIFAPFVSNLSASMYMFMNLAFIFYRILHQILYHKSCHIRLQIKENINETTVGYWNWNYIKYIFLTRFFSSSERSRLPGSSKTKKIEWS